MALEFLAIKSLPHSLHFLLYVFIFPFYIKLYIFRSVCPTIGSSEHPSLYGIKTESLKKIFIVIYLLYHNASTLYAGKASPILSGALRDTSLTTVIIEASSSNVTPACCADTLERCKALEISAALVAYALSNAQSVTWGDNFPCDLYFLL